jgi:hypothetical protein
MFFVEDRVVCGKRKHYVICSKTNHIMLITSHKGIAQSYAKSLETSS